MNADGYSLDDKRSETSENDIPDIIARFGNLTVEAHRVKTDPSFFVDKADIAANGYDLSINRYKETVYEKAEYDAPFVIMTRLDELSLTIADKREELRGLLDE
jgi:type I restriction enzyme M protein